MSIYLNPVAEKEAVKALGDDIGFGRIIQLAHECWDEMLVAKYGPTSRPHSEGWTLASADIIRERRGPPPTSAISQSAEGVQASSAQDDQINWKALATTAEAERDEANRQRCLLADRCLAEALERQSAERLLEVARGALEKIATASISEHAANIAREALSVLSGGRDLNGSRDLSPNTGAASKSRPGEVG